MSIKARGKYISWKSILPKITLKGTYAFIKQPVIHAVVSQSGKMVKVFTLLIRKISNACKEKTILDS